MSLLELTMADEKVVWVAAVHSERAYVHMYEGIPTKESNDAYVGHFGKRVERIFHGPYPWYVLPPERRADERPISLGGRLVTREMLPEYWVAALCYADGMSSCLVLIWFQNDLVPLVPGDVRERLATIDWEEHAQEFTP